MPPVSSSATRRPLSSRESLDSGTTTDQDHSRSDRIGKACNMLVRRRYVSTLLLLVYTSLVVASAGHGPWSHHPASACGAWHRDRCPEPVRSAAGSASQHAACHSCGNDRPGNSISAHCGSGHDSDLAGVSPAPGSPQGDVRGDDCHPGVHAPCVLCEWTSQTKVCEVVPRPTQGTTICVATSPWRTPLEATFRGPRLALPRAPPHPAAPRVAA